MVLGPAQHADRFRDVEDVRDALGGMIGIHRDVCRTGTDHGVDRDE